MAAALCCTQTAWAAVYSYSTEADGQITTGDVSITLREYELGEDGEEHPYVDEKQVVPGQRVSKIVRITNEANDAWIRAKAMYRGQDQVTEFPDSMIGGISDSWIRCGSYYYYERPVPAGESVDFFRQVTIPGAWDRQTEGQTFSIGVTAQAVQAANFSPDFSGEEPWFGIPVEACIHSSHALFEGSGEPEFAVIFEDGSEGFIKSGDDFFAGFPSMLPGDKKTGTLVIGNRFRPSLSVWFRTEVPGDQSEAALELLSRLELTIRKGEEVLYHGPLHGRTLQEAMKIAPDLKRGEEAAVTYEVFMPEDLDNAYALRQARVRWIFSTQYRVSNGGGGGSSGGSRPGASDSSGPGVAPVTEILPQGIPLVEELLPEPIREIINPRLPKLGDCGIPALLLGTMAVSGGLLLLGGLTWYRKKGRRR